MHGLKSAIFSKNVFYPFSAFDVFTDVSIYSAYNTVYSRASRSEYYFALPTRHFGLLFDNRQSQLFFRLIPIRIFQEFRKNFAVNCFFRQEVDICQQTRYYQNSSRSPDGNKQMIPKFSKNSGQKSS